jgi:hypothetical protein
VASVASARGRWWLWELEADGGVGGPWHEPRGDRSRWQRRRIVARASEDGS